MQERRRAGQDDRSLGELFAELIQELTTLLRQELLLARTELGQKAARVGRDIASVAIGGAVAYAGLLAIIASVIIGLADLGLPWWLSALLVGVAVALVGYFLIQRGLTALRREDLTPRQTIETLREDARFVKEQTK